MPLTKTEKVTRGPEEPTTESTTLPSGFRFNQTAAKAHAMEPAHTRGVVSSRGLEEGIKLPPRALPSGVALSFNTDGFVADLNAALAANTAGYVMQLRQHGQPIASAQSGLAHRPADGSESWMQTVRMHIASCSKLITAIAMTRTLAAHSLPASTKIIDFLPDYWAKGSNIDKITFAQLMTHTSGFRVTGSDTFFPIMKSQVATGVTSANLGVYSYQNMNFSICRMSAPKEGSRLNLQHSSETFHLSGPDSDRSIVAPPDGEFAAIEEGFENGA